MDGSHTLVLRTLGFKKRKTLSTTDMQN
uniref:Uncharacterized protein n=1 Tax=Anguilla anguilla TaxID=7936 RepID=A0A0E9XEK2_ANGAN